MNAQRRTAVPVMLWLLLVTGCGGPSGPEQIIVAEVGDGRITRVELEYYLESNLLQETDDEPLPANEMNAIRSRLLDALVEERILLAEADRHGIQVTDIEIGAYVAQGEPGPTEKTPDADPRWRAARRRLRIEKLQAKIALELPPIEDREVLEFMDRQIEQPDDRELVLRALMLADREVADRVHRDITRNRITFAEAVVAHGDTTQGFPTQVSWLSLPEEVREALDGKKPGRVSDPVEMLGSIYLFQVDSWLDSPPRADGERARRALRELDDLRHRSAVEELLEDARRRTRVRILHRNLPFAYVPAGQG